MMMEKIKACTLLLFFWSGSLIGFLGSAISISSSRWLDGISFFLTFLVAAGLLFHHFLSLMEHRYQAGYLMGVLDCNKHERMTDSFYEED